MDIEKIERLMLSKDFNALSEKEKEYILSEIGSEQEFSQMRETLKRVKTTFKEEAVVLQSTPDFKEKLLNVFEQNRVQTPGFWERMIAHLNEHINSYRLAGGMAIAAIAVFIFLNLNETAEPNQTAVNTPNPPTENKDTNQIQNAIIHDQLKEESKIVASADEKEEIVTTMSAGKSMDDVVPVMNEASSAVENKVAPEEPDLSIVTKNAEGYYQYDNNNIAYDKIAAEKQVMSTNATYDMSTKSKVKEEAPRKINKTEDLESFKKGDNKANRLESEKNQRASEYPRSSQGVANQSAAGENQNSAPLQSGSVTSSISQENLQIAKYQDLGSNKKLTTYVQKAIQYPANAKENKIQGTVYVSFDIAQYKAYNVFILKGIDADLDAEARRLVKETPSIVWENVGLKNQNYVLPIQFKLK